MAKIKVLSPITSNGINPVLDEKGQIRYKETIMDARAKPTMDKINAALPDHLKRKIEVIEDQPATKVKPATKPAE